MENITFRHVCSKISVQIIGEKSPSSEKICISKFMPRRFIGGCLDASSGKGVPSHWVKSGLIGQSVHLTKLTNVVAPNHENSYQLC